MSAPDARPTAGATDGVAISLCRTDVTELAALRNRAAELEAIAARRGLRLPPNGHVVTTADLVALAVRPQRWLLLSAPAAPGAAAATWQALCADTAAAVDLSSGITALHLAGPSARDALARGCRLDLAAESFPPGRAAATMMAQVSTILAALPSGILILTPASTARHLREWLVATARPFGLAPPADD